MTLYKIQLNEKSYSLYKSSKLELTLVILRYCTDASVNVGQFSKKKINFETTTLEWIYRHPYFTKFLHQSTDQSSPSFLFFPETSPCDPKKRRSFIVVNICGKSRDFSQDPTSYFCYSLAHLRKELLAALVRARNITTLERDDFRSPSRVKITSLFHLPSINAEKLSLSSRFGQVQC